MILLYCLFFTNFITFTLEKRFNSLTSDSAKHVTQILLVKRMAITLSIAIWFNKAKGTEFACLSSANILSRSGSAFYAQILVKLSYDFCFGVFSVCKRPWYARTFKVCILNWLFIIVCEWECIVWQSCTMNLFKF